MPVEDHDLLELANENCQLSLDLVRSSESVPATHNPVNCSLTIGEQLANQVVVIAIIIQLLSCCLVVACEGG